MIKILFFTDKFEYNHAHGGAERVLCLLANHMDRSKFDITVQTVWPEDPTKYLRPDIHYKSIFKKRGKLQSYLYRFLTACHLTYPLFVRGDYDLEVAYLESGPTKIISTSTNRKAKKIAWVHCDLMVIRSDPQAFARRTAAQYRKFDRVACVAQQAQESFARLFGDTPPSQVVHNVVDDAEVRAKAAEPLPDGVTRRKPTLISVGRLTPAKNPFRLLKAHERLLAEGVDHDLWLVGDGELHAEVKQFVQEHGLTDSVQMLGFQSNPYPFVREADAVVCSSDSEGYSTAIVESMLLGKPIVTTDCSGMREILGNSEYGLITDNDDDAFYEGVRRMLTEEGLLTRYAAAAR